MVSPLYGAETEKDDVPFSSSQGYAGGLTLDQAVSLAFARNHGLSAASLEVSAREGRIVQSHTRPNPEIDLESANIYGNKTLSNLDGSENTVTVNQLIELGGKRSKRTVVASLDRDLGRWDHESKKADVRAEVTKAFIDVLTEQERIRLSEDIVRLAGQALATVSARVQAGKVSPIDETKAIVALSLAKVELEKAWISLRAARTRLASIWGSSEAVFTVAEGRLNVPPAIPAFSELSGKISRNPDVARWATELDERKAVLSLEQANRIPDPSLRGGVRYFRENGETAFVIGLSIPLPIFNQNKGAIQEAQSRVIKANAEQASTLVKVQAALSDAHQSMSASFTEAATLSDSILPSLESAYNAVLEGYRYGKFPFLDVLDAQRALFESKAKQIDSLSSFRKSEAEVERLIGAGGTVAAGKAK